LSSTFNVYAFFIKPHLYRSPVFLQALEDVRIEKQAQKDKFEADIAGLERLLEEQKVTAENNLQEQLSSLHSRYTKELDTLKAEGQLRAKELEQVKI